MPKVTAEQIMEIAEDMIRKHGYHAFSFREIATKVGIKSSSVHYHFPTKVDLAIAVAKRYSDRFFNTLDGVDQHSQSPKQIIADYIDVFRRALINDRKLCLCGMLGAEKAVLPEKVLPEIQSFFVRNLQWLSHVVVTHGCDRSEDEIHQRASCLLATLEGALIVSQTLEDDQAFEDIALLAQADFLSLLS